ncbi:hypothetical protein NTD80_23585, partial [Pseudomonas sp. 13B_2.1_Bac1]|uniref:hypothetical protein n=1 Tax=Pseudomonas sp. 13B_2.1_Bac1 TaxID=2971624 RepID=UPI0021C6B4E5
MVQAFLQHLVEEGRRRILRIKISPCENVLHHTKNAETLCIDFPERHADSDFCHESVGSSPARLQIRTPIRGQGNALSSTGRAFRPP